MLHTLSVSRLVYDSLRTPTSCVLTLGAGHGTVRTLNSLSQAKQGDVMQEPVDHSPAEQSVVLQFPATQQIPSTHDMSEVHTLAGAVARLEQDLELA